MLVSSCTGAEFSNLLKQHSGSLSQGACVFEFTFEANSLCVKVTNLSAGISLSKTLRRRSGLFGSLRLNMRERYFAL